MWYVPEPEACPDVAYWADTTYHTLYRRITTNGTPAYAWADMRDVIQPWDRADRPELLTDEWHLMDTSGDLGEVTLAWIQNALPDGGIL